ncbi:MAG: RNA-binding cell elongation regulator Jag/EloR [Planctomycetaceae bacterium]
MTAMDAYREFTGKSVEEALKNAREEFGVGLDDLDFEILTPGSRGVLGMGAEPARVLAAPRSALGGAAPKREAAAAKPLPTPPPRDRDEDRGFGRRDRFGDRDRGRSGGPTRDGDRGGRGYGDRDRGYGDRARPGGPSRDDRGAGERFGRFGERRSGGPAREGAAPAAAPAAGSANGGAGARRDDRRRRFDDRGRAEGPAREGGPGDRRGGVGLTEREEAEVTAARGSVAAERAELEAAEASPEALAAGKVILERLLVLMGFDVRVEVEAGETSRLNVLGEGEERDALGALIGRKGERLSALQHLVNLMLSREMGAWTRVLVDVEDYRGRRERQLREIAERAAGRVLETGKMLQLEPMPALERRWIHLALRNNPDVATQSIGEEPNRRIVVLPRNV